jgi:hypothetical protein
MTVILSIFVLLPVAIFLAGGFLSPAGVAALLVMTAIAGGGLFGLARLIERDA